MCWNGQLEIEIRTFIRISFQFHLGRYFRYAARKAGLFKILHHITKLQHCMRLKIVLHNSSHTRATYKDIKAFSMATHLFLGLECLCEHGIAFHTFKV
jgi:hypothetical protein